MKAKENFIYNPSDKDYIIALKKSRLWWIWLLLGLLLFLILLIPLKKDIAFKTYKAGDKNILSETVVNLQYTEYKLIDFENFNFFTKKITNYEQISGADGIATFENLHYSIYDLLFHFNKTIYASAYKDCFLADSIMPPFRTLSVGNPYDIYLGYRKTDYEFRVLDIDEDEPLPDAVVEGYAISSGGDSIYYKAKTDPAGIVVLKNFPYCGKAFLTASKQGYENDTLAGDSRYFYGNIDTARTFYLTPQKAVIKFIIRDLKTKEPLANATAHLIIDGETVQTVKTNINGVGLSVGEGEFGPVSVFKTFTILGQKEFYHDSTLSDSVARFIGLPEEDRTLYLRPATIVLKFRNIDGKGNPLPGVRNEIYINGKRRSPEYSNSNGYFIVSGINPEDKISITASKNGYVTNNYTVRNDKVSKVTNNSSKLNIPLKKKQSPPPPPPPPPQPEPPGPPPNVVIKPCEQPQESGGYGVTVNVHSLGNSKSFNLAWDMYSIPDRIIVYCGAGANKTKIYDTGRPVSNKGRANFSCNKHYITIKIIGPDQSTKWWYKMNCQ